VHCRADGVSAALRDEKERAENWEIAAELIALLTYLQNTLYTFSGGCTDLHFILQVALLFVTPWSVFGDSLVGV